MLGAVVLLVTRKWLPLSGISYTMILVFFTLHIIGAHYTYAEVPYDAAFKDLTGTSFNELVGWKRNNYDRVVHFSYGLLLAYPIRELFLRVANVRGFWGYFLPLDLTMSTSMLYELMRVAGRGGVRQRAGRRIPGLTGRPVGRAERHGARVARRADHDDRHGHRQLGVPARFRARNGSRACGCITSNRSAKWSCGGGANRPPHREELLQAARRLRRPSAAAERLAPPTAQATSAPRT